MDNRKVRRRSASASGVTLLEIVIALSILTVLLGIGALNFRSPAERTAADAIQSLIQQGRFEALRSNRSVVVSFDPVARAFSIARMANSTETRCALAVDVTRTLPLVDFSSVRTPDEDFAFLWLPTGQPRACPTGTTPLSFESGISFAVSGQGTTLTVAVSAGGEVVVR